MCHVMKCNPCDMSYDVPLLLLHDCMSAMPLFSLAFASLPCCDVIHWRSWLWSLHLLLSLHIYMTHAMLCCSADLLGFIGALGFGPSTYCFPSMFWLAIKKPGVTSWHFWASWFCILCGVIVTVLGAIGGMQGIIVDASSYKFYQ